VGAEVEQAAKKMLETIRNETALVLRCVPLYVGWDMRMILPKYSDAKMTVTL
jgi:hypothetical protein